MITPHRHTVRDWLAFVVLTLTIVLIASLLAAWQVRAHDTPEGWSYSPECCGGLDCEPVPATIIVEPRDGGWFIPETGETIPYGDKRVRQSKDENFHRCRMSYRDSQSKTRCLYTPIFGG